MTTPAAAKMDLSWLSSSSMSEQSLDVGAFLFRRDDPVNAIYVIRSGTFLLQRILRSGTGVVVGRANEGDLFPEAALFAKKYHCDAVCARKALVTVLKRDAVVAAMTEDSSRAIAMIAMLSRQIRALRALLEIRTEKSARERLLLWLRIQSADAEIGSVRWSSVANEIGLSPESVYRALAELEATGVISRNGKAVSLTY